MTPEDAVDVGREAIMMMLLTSAPILATGLVVGVLAGVFQAVTQIQEQAIGTQSRLTLACRSACPILARSDFRNPRQFIAGCPPAR